MSLLDANTVVNPSEPSIVIFETSTKIGLSIVPRMDAKGREAKASGDLTISGTIFEGCTIFRFQKSADAKRRRPSEM
jgi:hypothetical protein